MPLLACLPIFLSSPELQRTAPHPLLPTPIPSKPPNPQTLSAPQDYPAAGCDVRHPHDASVMTYRGHSVQHTLIRAYFSPAHTTGQRFIYTGSVGGGIHVYDVVSGQEVEGSPFRLHRKVGVAGGGGGGSRAGAPAGV